MKLRKIDENNKKHEYSQNREIPLLLFNTNENTKYYKYTKILENIIKNIQCKIIEYFKIHKFPPLCPLECIVLQFMIKLFDDGSYSDIPIMDIYSIINCYDLSCDVIEKEHTEQNKCICHKCFNECISINLPLYDEIRESIKNHYNNVESIKKIICNYKKYISENLIFENIIYNVEHSVFFGEKNKNFSIRNDYTIIGYSENHIIYFILKPQFNQLNFNNIMCEAILNNFMILNCSPDSENNYTKYNSKKIITCILTLDSIEPIFYEINIDKNNILIKQIIKNYLITKYSEHHEQIYKFYKFCYKNKPKNKNSIKYTMDELNKHEKLPKYISELFYDVNKELELCGNDKNKIDKVLIKINDKELFINNLNICLEKKIDLFLEMNQDESINEYIDY